MEQSVGIVETRFARFAEKPEDYIELDSGRKFGPVTVAYETYGTLNEKKDNAVLICHALSGDAHAAGFHREWNHKPGWWDDAVGPGKAFDTNRYFIICSNVIGGCVGTTGPATTDPATGRPYGLRFPVVTIGDMVKVEKLLVDSLGISKLLAVAGGSMGGMQALEWALRYPENTAASIVIAATPRLSPQSIAFHAVGRNSITSDPNFMNGDFYGSALPSRGLSIARMVGHITYLSDESMNRKFGRRLQNRDEFSYDFSAEFEVESYLEYNGLKFVERFDANSYLYVTKAMDYFDVAQTYGNGSLDKALENVKSRMLVLSFTSDWLFPPNQSQEIVDSMIRNGKDVSYYNIPSAYGHDAFLLEVEVLGEILSKFLAATQYQVRTSGGRI